MKRQGRSAPDFTAAAVQQRFRTVSRFFPSFDHSAVTRL
jgi:hypothetical protein